MKKAILVFALGIISAFSQGQKQQFTVYFESGSAEIPQNSKEELTGFFSNESIDAGSLSVVAYCDDVGSSSSNITLSEERAKAVISFLKNYDFDHVSSKGKGEIALTQNPETENQRAANRRATIVVDYTVLPDEVPVTVKTEEAPDKNYKTFDDNLKVGDKVIIRQLLFDGSRTSFLNPEDAEAELSKIVDYFTRNPNVHFEIQGHVCCITNSFKDARNIETGLNNLSKARAQKIYEFFVSKGIPKERMTHQGYGRQYPRKDVVESLNKRVEIVITKI